MRPSSHLSDTTSRLEALVHLRSLGLPGPPKKGTKFRGDKVDLLSCLRDILFNEGLLMLGVMEGYTANPLPTGQKVLGVGEDEFAKLFVLGAQSRGVYWQLLGFSHDLIFTLPPYLLNR